MLSKTRHRSLPHPRGLLRLRSGADRQILIGLGDAQRIEVRRGHRIVIVLPGVDNDRFASARDARAVHRCEFREVRSRANDVKNLQGGSLRVNRYKRIAAARSTVRCPQGKGDAFAPARPSRR